MSYVQTVSASISSRRLLMSNILSLPAPGLQMDRLLRNFVLLAFTLPPAIPHSVSIVVIYIPLTKGTPPNFSATGKHLRQDDSDQLRRLKREGVLPTESEFRLNLSEGYFHDTVMPLKQPKSSHCIERYRR
jgi:hypothetical protein